MSNNNETCYANFIDKERTWGENEAPLLGPLPNLVLQLTLAMASNLIFYHLLQPLHQPRIVSDIISGLILNPGIWGTDSNFVRKHLWVEKGMTNLTSLANLSVLYLMFFKGLQMDFTPIARLRKKTLTLTAALILLPFAVGCSLFFWLHDDSHGRATYVYWGAVMASTSFPSLASILARLKLLCTELGREALSLGMVNEVCCMILLVMVIALSAAPSSGKLKPELDPTIFVLLFTLLFGIFCFGLIRPFIRWLIKRTNDGENYSNTFIVSMFFMVMACGLVTEFFGAYSMLGAFMLGLCIPHGHLASTLIEKMEDCVLGVLLPLFFMLVCRDVNFEHFDTGVFMVFSTVLVKPLCGILASFFCNVSFRDGASLGVLLSSQGLVSVVMIAIGLERGHLPNGAFSGLLLYVLFSTMIVSPAMSLVYKSMISNSTPYQHRTIQGTRPYADFRVVACIHSNRNISSIVNLLGISDISPQLPMSVFAIHLVELIGRSAAMFVVHESGNASSSSSWGGSANSFFSRQRVQSDQVVSAFASFEQEHHASTKVQTLTVVSSIDTMHEDISSVVEDKRATLVLLPFHKQQGMDGKLEDTNTEFRSVNQNVMASAPCSVGILVDRGLSLLSLMPSSPASSLGNSSRHHDDLQRSQPCIAMIYIGGPDDREALSYAWRMSAHPLATLTVIRFIVGDHAVDIEQINFAGDKEEDGILTTMTRTEKEKEIDDEFMDEFRERAMNDESIEYIEVVSNSGDETVNLLRGMEHNYDLYVVGRGRSMISPLTVGIAEWSDSPELGAIGDVLVNSDFAAHVSVLVVQQYAGARLHVHEKVSLDGVTVIPSS